MAEKIKLFSKGSHDTLEQEVNEWLMESSKKGKEIIDISLSFSSREQGPFAGTPI